MNGKESRSAEFFYGLFYGRENFGCKTAQFCATRCESEMTETPGVGNAVVSRRQDVTVESGECAESDAALEAE